MDLGLDGRVYIITGGSRGLGYATAQALVADGARVVLSSRDPEHVAAAAESLGPLAIGVVADLTDQDTPDRLIQAATNHFGRLDGALISVGGPPPGTAAAMTDEQWRSAFETVFLGTVRALRVIASALSEGAAIGVVLSTTVKTPLTGLGLSNGLRPGLAMAAKDMADEYGPRGVRIVGLLPGRIMTDRNRELFADADDPAAAAAEAAGTIPLRRVGEPEEFGKVAAFVLSPAAGYVTGAVVPVDGGYLRAL
ncbi:SDR family oxidoreductase [Actinoplanes sp. KI2]|uniref:SDR family oxidoreductase n=1 Tax=Actinoplanes sp. KI2 TaxID=2983315 RepID=UPI0021D5DBB7|nr:SDR family oxidoreductase [Actinoplanes sp. KI2]MCU7723402.1 SDR family oxidoreductase [Actinoplanes sp. KI2]